jgi:hypothetical protein
MKEKKMKDIPLIAKENWNIRESENLMISKEAIY